jgi:oligosaccharide repeat unit polymerase
MWLLIFVIEVLLIVRYEKRYFGTIYTPSIFLSVPTVIIFILTYLFGEKFGFYPMHTSCLSVWCIGLFIFFAVGIFINSLLKVKKQPNPFKIELTQKNVNHQILLFVGLLASFIYIILILSYSASHKIAFGTDQYMNYVQSDLIAHLTILLRYFFMYSVVCIRKKFSLNNTCHIIIITTTIIAAIFTGSKSALFITLFSALLIRLLIHNVTLRFRLKYIIYLGISIFGVFFLVYYLRGQQDIEWILNHIVQYAGFGIESFSQYFHCDKPIGIQPERMYFSLLNVWNKIIGQSPAEMYNLWVNAGAEIEGNVNTFFGGIYIFGGIGIGIITTIICSMISYLLFYLALRKNIFFIFVYTILLTNFLLYAWFDYYIFNTIWFYEYLVLAFLFALTLKRL